MFVTLERVFKHPIREITTLKSQRQSTIYQSELYELKYSFLKRTLENVTCVTSCKAKQKFQTSHFVPSELMFCNLVYLIGTYN